MRISDLAHYPYYKPAGVVVFDTPEGETEFHRRYPYAPNVKEVRAYAGEGLGANGFWSQATGAILALAFVFAVTFTVYRFISLSDPEMRRLERRFPKYFEGGP